MELAQAYREIERRLDRIDFPALYRGFSRFPFALYNDTQAYTAGGYIEKPGNFIGNTSVKADGTDTAIWMLGEDPGDLDVLASKIVHEMLHAFQNASGEKRWADERAALVKYRYEEANLAGRLEETKCIRECLEQDAPKAFARLLGLRKARMERFPFEYDYEARIEQIEGTAHFAENGALAQLAPEKAEKSRERMLADLSDPAKYFPVRAITYLSGAAFIACLRKYTDMDTDTMTDTPFAVAAITGAEPCDLPESDPGAAKCLAEWKKASRDVVNRTIAKGEVVLEGTNRMICWNVYDGTWDGQYAVLTSFIGYIEGDEMPQTDEELFAKMKMLNGSFVAELDGELRLGRVWRQ